MRIRIDMVMRFRIIPLITSPPTGNPRESGIDAKQHDDRTARLSLEQNHREAVIEKAEKYLKSTCAYLDGGKTPLTKKDAAEGESPGQKVTE